jgi:hypothetical protein
MVGATPTPVHTSTMRYLPYELIVAEDTVTPTKASDIYALGCLALEVKFICIIGLLPIPLIPV